MPSHEWDNMGKQDFSCQMWLEQGGGRGERREHCLPCGYLPLPLSLPANPPSLPPQRYRGDPRLQPPLVEGSRGGRGEEG